MQQFLKDTIESRFIKALLYNTYLPIYNTVSYGDYLVEGQTYVFKKDLITCTKSGYLGSISYEEYRYLSTEELELITNNENASFTTTQTYTVSEDTTDSVKKSLANNSVVSYDFGTPYPRYTDNYVSKYSYYDSNMHRRLGKYLRCYRDIFDINLMPFYNCFDGSYLSQLQIKTAGVMNNTRSTAKIFRVPIKFNKTYTIALDSQSEVWLAPAVMNHGAFTVVTYMDDGGNETEYDLTELVSAKDNAVVRYNSTSFNAPFTYRLNNKDSSDRKVLAKYENDLYLLVQVSQTNNSSLVVLEGDYTGVSSNKVFSCDHIDDITPSELNRLLLSDLSLLRLSDKKCHPYSNRLVEYLLLNVITKEDEFSNNVELTQNYILDSSNLYDDYFNYKGIWTNYLRYKVFNNYKNNYRYTHIDNNGYVDKDVEFMMQRGGNNY